MENLSFFSVWGGLLLGTILYLLLAYRHQQFRWSSSLIRIGLFAALLFFLQVIIDPSTPSQAPLTVLVDTSRSMAPSDLPSEDVAKFISKQEKETIQQFYPDHEIFYYDLFPPHSNLDTQALASPNWDLKSPILAHLQTFLEKASPGQNHRFLLLSDGLDSEFRNFPSKVGDSLKKHGVVIDTVQWDQEESTPELSILDIQNPRVVFDQTAISIQVKIRSHLNAPASSNLVLTDGQSILNKVDLQFPSGDEQRVVDLKWTPRTHGSTLLFLRLDSLEGEKNLHDNLEYIPIDVRSKKLKVLHIAGRPGWDVRNLRKILKSIPGLDLISFYILRDPFKDSQTVPEGELALIQFPVKALFQTELFKFDTVLFHNFAIQSYLKNPAYQKSFQQYLASGKKVIVIGGEQVEDDEKYKELFLKPGKGLPKFQFFDLPNQSSLALTQLTGKFVVQQPSFPWVAPQQSSPNLLESTRFDLGQVDWVFTPSLWKSQHSRGSDRLGASTAFAAFWQSLLYQGDFEKSNVFRDFRPNLPYTTADSIAGNLHLTPLQLQGVNRLSLQVSDQMHNAIVWEEEIDLAQSPIVVQIPKLAASLYEMRLTCNCSSMSDIKQSLTVVDEWLEAHESHPNNDWLQQLSQMTGGKTIPLTGRREG